MPTEPNDVPLVLRQVTLATRGEPVRAPQNLVYSTAPTHAVGTDDDQFYVKGESNIRIVLAESIAYTLAQNLEIPVPEFAIGFYEDSDAPVFASQILDKGVRDVSFWLNRSKIANMAILARLIVFDTWLANNDRNLGNLLGVPLQGTDQSIKLVAIDFEKSATVRSEAPMIEIPTMQAREFWPRGELGTICRKLVVWDPSAIQAISSVTDSTIDATVNAALAATNANASIGDSIGHSLKHRRNRIEPLAREVWNS